MRRMFALAGLAVLATTPAVAAERGFYVGFDAGQYSYDLDEGGLNASIAGLVEDAGLSIVDGSSETSEDGFTYGVFVGYQVFRFLAVEAAYVDLGDAEYKSRAVVTDGLNTANLSAQLTAESSGPTLSVLGILPIGPSWEVYGRAGVYFASDDVSAQLAVDGVSDPFSDSSSSEEFLWGVGVGYTQAQWTLRLDYQQFMDVGDEDTTGEADVDRIALAAIFRF